MVFKALQASIDASLAPRSSLTKACIPEQLQWVATVPLPFLQALLSAQVQSPSCATQLVCSQR